MCRCSGCSMERKSAGAIFSFILRSHKYGMMDTRFHVLEKKKRSSVERSEGNGYLLGFITKERPGELVVNPQYNVMFALFGKFATIG